MAEKGVVMDKKKTDRVITKPVEVEFYISVLENGLIRLQLRKDNTGIGGFDMPFGAALELISLLSNALIEATNSADRDWN
jgi:hypothetical protein